MSCSESSKPCIVAVSGLVRLYAANLESRGYRPSVVGAYCAAVEHFICSQAPEADHLEVNRSAVRRFVEVHLPTCDCAGRVQRGTVTVRAALNHLLLLLSGMGIYVEELKISPGIDKELQDYSGFASQVSGLAAATLLSRRQWIGRFLVHQFPKGLVEIPRLQPKHIRAFFTARCRTYKPGTAQVVASAIRSYFRFRAVRHADPVESLVAAIPSAANWKLAVLPQILQENEIGALMAAFDRTLPQQQRDYAIVRCLADLGLRSCEVAAIALDDIDWKHGTLRIRSGKAQREDILPLPVTTGHAIAEYLRDARPATLSRAVFVRHQAPLDTPVNASVIRSAVRYAAARAGLADKLQGPHRLRHSAAARMLHGGASLKEIADILRHRSLDTTAIYAKVDVPRLAAIAQPWPGGAV